MSSLFMDVFGTRNKHGIPLVELRVFGRKDIEGLREWVEKWVGRQGGNPAALHPLLPKRICKPIVSFVSLFIKTRGKQWDQSDTTI